MLKMKNEWVLLVCLCDTIHFNTRGARDRQVDTTVSIMPGRLPVGIVRDVIFVGSNIKSNH
jgi:hypothetical protein